MNQEQERLLVEGIKLLVICSSDIVSESRINWLEKYNKLFPKEEPFGGPI